MILHEKNNNNSKREKNEKERDSMITHREK